MEDQASKRLYAVEGVRNETYTICRLVQWVTVHDFGSAPTKVKQIRGDRQFMTDTGDNQWWRKAALDFSRPCPKSRCNNENTSSYRIRLSLKPPRDETRLPVSEDCVSELEAVKSASEPVIGQKVATIVTDDAPAPSTDPGDIHDMIRASYLEDLYIKKVNIRRCCQRYH